MSSSRIPSTAFPALSASWSALRALAAGGVVALLAVGSACPAAQVKDGGGSSGGVEIVLRRIDIVNASYEKMDLKVIVAVKNGTNSDVDVSADASIALAGKADDAEGGEEASEEEGGDEAGDEDDGGSSAPADAKRFAGAGRGTAVANNTSELPIFVTLMLPDDPAALEEILGWGKARVHIAGKVKAGFEDVTIAGERDLAMPKLPKFRLKSAQVAKVDNGTAGEAFITLLLENQNSFGVTIDNVSWRVLIADKELRTKEDGGTSIPPSSVEEYNISIPLDETGFPEKGALKALLKQPSISYRIDAAFTARGLRGSELLSGDMAFP
jgi:LEA14-like dessication related protein/ribosomal protein L12E/L44/L45/RPP1/RPP2